MKKFESSMTKIEPFFTTSNEEKINVNMMHIDGEFRSGYVKSLDARILELPYLVCKLHKVNFFFNSPKICYRVAS